MSSIQEKFSIVEVAPEEEHCAAVMERAIKGTKSHLCQKTHLTDELQKGPDGLWYCPPHHKQKAWKIRDLNVAKREREDNVQDAKQDKDISIKKMKFMAEQPVINALAESDRAAAAVLEKQTQMMARLFDAMNNNNNAPAPVPAIVPPELVQMIAQQQHQIQALMQQVTQLTKPASPLPSQKVLAILPAPVPQAPVPQAPVPQAPVTQAPVPLVQSPPSTPDITKMGFSSGSDNDDDPMPDIRTLFPDE